MPNFGISRDAFLSEIFARAVAVASNKGPAKGATPTAQVAKLTVSAVKDIGPVCKRYDPKAAEVLGSEF